MVKSATSLYFHIPFCTKKCDYCHFYVLPDLEPLKQQLMEGLFLEWQRQLPFIDSHPIVSIYFGGGTPSLLGPERIDTILSWVKQTAIVDASCEITLEANPDNITSSLMKAYRDAGINRVSIGIQSLDEALLKRLGRLHDAKRALNAVHDTYDAGISNISVDLMYDLPGQTLTDWERSLARTAQLPISHLSLYNLTIEPHTVFFKKRQQIEKLLPDEESSLQMYKTAIAVLEDAGLMQYEISAFERGGNPSRHNSGYWTGRPFMGFGPSAFSYWHGQRFRNCANLSKYLKLLKEGQSPIDFSEQLDPQASLRELFVIRLRLRQGVPIQALDMEFKDLDSATRQIIERLKKEDFLMIDSDHLKLTQRGILFYDTVASDLI